MESVDKKVQRLDAELLKYKQQMAKMKPGELMGWASGHVSLLNAM